MDIGSIFLILAIMVPVVLFIARPLMERSATVVTSEEHDYSALLAERDRILTSVNELDFDHALGKIPDEAYTAQRAIMMRMGADVLRQIDEYNADHTGIDADDNIETVIQVAKEKRTDSGIIMDPNDELETLISNRRSSQTENNQFRSGGFCPKCGNCVQESDRFCPKCGSALD